MIKIENLVKLFGSKRAVDDVSFTVGKGEVLGFLGPNGAGKSTTMRMITGFIPPDSGSIRIGEFDMLTDPIRAKQTLGYLPENAPLYTDMTVYGFLNFAAELRGLRGAERKKVVQSAVETCFLESVIHQNVDTLSKGFRHRACLAQSILHDPEYLILDEPTDGLDPNQKHEVRSLIRNMGKRKAIIFSTHILEEVLEVCTRTIIIDRGAIVANGSPAQLKAMHPDFGSVLITVRNVPEADLREKLKTLPTAAQIETVKNKEEAVTLRVYPKDKKSSGLSVQVAELAIQSGWRFDELHTDDGRLDEVFRAITLPDTVKKSKKEGPVITVNV